MPQYPPDDPSQARAEAAAAMLAAIREVRDANERLQVAAAWVLEAFGDTVDAETIRMLPVAGPARPGRPAVPPPAASRHLTDDLADEPTSVTGDESAPTEDCGCTWPQVDGLVPTDCAIHGARQ